MKGSSTDTSLKTHTPTQAVEARPNHHTQTHTAACLRTSPSTGHHQLDFDPVGHQDSQDLLVGDVLDAERRNKERQLHN